MLASGATFTNDPVDPSPALGLPPLGASRMADADDALGVLDRIARYCVFSCTIDTDRCLEEACAAWKLERAAASYLTGRWLDSQD